MCAAARGARAPSGVMAPPPSCRRVLRLEAAAEAFGAAAVDGAALLALGAAPLLATRLIRIPERFFRV